LVNPQTLFFTSVGATVAHGRGSYELRIDNVVVDSAKDQDLFYGVAFAAVGAETVLSSRLRGRFEYVASFLNTNEYDIGLGVPFEVTPMIGTAKAALIYDFGGGNGAAVPAGYAPASWTGFYAGVDGGQSVGLSKYSISADDDSFSYAGFGSDGWSGGALAGFNLQLGSSFVVGLEVGATASTLTSEYQFFDGSESIDFKGTNSSWYDARLRAGVLVSPGTLIYGFAGLSRINSDLTITDTTGLLGGGSMSQSYDRDAVEFGGGIEAYLARAFSLRAEYAYTMLDPIDAVPDYPEFGKFDMDQATATVAAIYHFGQ
jgi:outer membrane immunogenic protein